MSTTVTQTTCLHHITQVSCGLGDLGTRLVSLALDLVTSCFVRSCSQFRAAFALPMEEKLKMLADKNNRGYTCFQVLQVPRYSRFPGTPRSLAAFSRMKSVFSMTVLMCFISYVCSPPRTLVFCFLQRCCCLMAASSVFSVVGVCLLFAHSECVALILNPTM